MKFRKDFEGEWLIYYFRGKDFKENYALRERKGGEEDGQVYL